MRSVPKGASSLYEPQNGEHWQLIKYSSAQELPQPFSLWAFVSRCSGTWGFREQGVCSSCIAQQLARSHLSLHCPLFLPRPLPSLLFFLRELFSTNTSVRAPSPEWSCRGRKPFRVAPAHRLETTGLVQQCDGGPVRTPGRSPEASVSQGPTSSAHAWVLLPSSGVCGPGPLGGHRARHRHRTLG